MKKKTIAEWNSQGRWIKKGSKAVDFDDSGKALFTKSQTALKFKNYEDYKDYNHKNTNYNQGKYYFGGDNPDQMDYDLGLCGQD
jgi:hypothetical protein